MSTFRASTVAGRVVLIHDLDEQTIISELDLDQADVLLEQLQLAVHSLLIGLRERARATPMLFSACDLA